MGYSKKQLAQELIGATEAADLLGIAPGTVTSYLSRGQILSPLLTLRCGPLWLRSDLERWQEKRRPSSVS